MCLPSAIVLRHPVKKNNYCHLPQIYVVKCSQVYRLHCKGLPSRAKVYEFPFCEPTQPSIVDACLETDQEGRNIYELAAGNESVRFIFISTFSLQEISMDVKWIDSGDFIW